jgi:glycosyltransferase involved in cell wall biosynthesis
MLKLSIIIPVYKVENYIQKCIESILRQNIYNDDYEVIIIDDGSPDNSVKIVENLLKKINNIIIYKQQNKGLSYARNEGIKISKGKYLWFVDSDDWIEINSITKIIDAINIIDADVFVTPMRKIEESTGETTLKLFNNFKVVSKSTLIDLLKNIDNITPVQKYIIKKSFLIENDLKFYLNIYHEDLEFVPRMLFNANYIYIINDVIYNYLKRENGSITSTYSIKRSNDLILIIISLKNFYKKNKLNFLQKIYFKNIILGCFYHSLDNLSKLENYELKNYFYINKLIIKNMIFNSFISFNKRFTFYGLLLFINYKLFYFYLKIK